MSETHHAGDRFDRLDPAEQWFADAFRVIPVAGAAMTMDVDMSRARALVERMRRAGVKVTYNHVVVRAAALVLKRHPHLQTLLAGSRRLRSTRVDIGMSVAGTGETSYSPVMVIEDAGSKALPALVEEVIGRLPAVREKEIQDLAWMRKLGWIIPLGFLRRAIVRLILSSLRKKRELSGTFQVTCVPAEIALPLMFNTAACLGVGRVSDRVVAVDGKPEVRPVVTLSCAVDHSQWEGTRTVQFMSELKRMLDGEGFADIEAESQAGQTSD